MKGNGKAWLLAFVMGILLPGLLFSVAEKLVSPRMIPNTDPTEHTTQQDNAYQDPPPAESKSTVRVLFSDGTVQAMDMDTYLTGVLLGEMPVDFEVEALKAQAVVARTYALKRSASGDKHPQGAVCTQAACCQAYRPATEYLAQGGTPGGVSKVLSAVRATSGQVLVYRGELIEATYFSCSGGRTEDARAVWGTDIPYLQAVDSPGEEGATHYADSVEFTSREFADRLGFTPSGKPTAWFGGVTYTDGGGVDTIMIGGKAFQGTSLRQKLGLRSTAFIVSVLGDTIKITTRGFGHRVGMSQYGAEAMAVQGSDYRQILAHYYPGTEINTHT